MKARTWIVFGLVALATAGAAWWVAPPPAITEAQPGPGFYSYAAKFVCGWNRSNVGFDQPTTSPNGEATVKLGNYATEINIFNPQYYDFEIKKRVIVLYRSDAPFPPIGREPNVIRESGGESIPLPTLHGTMDDCNKIYQMAGIPIVNPPTLIIGWLVIAAEREIDVTGVYTAELCSDFRFGLGAGNMCYNAGNPNYGVSLSIDVEEVDGKLITQ